MCDKHPHLPLVEEETADVWLICDRLIHTPSMHSDPRRIDGVSVCIKCVQIVMLTVFL